MAMAQEEQNMAQGDNYELRDSWDNGRSEYFMDVDRMVNEGLGGGTVTSDNGLIDDSTTDTMDHPDSVIGETDAAQ
jgi:hypothetical protein